MFLQVIMHMSHRHVTEGNCYFKIVLSVLANMLEVLPSDDAYKMAWQTEPGS